VHACATNVVDVHGVPAIALSTRLCVGLGGSDRGKSRGEGVEAMREVTKGKG
jgi:hypothetical protein